MKDNQYTQMQKNHYRPQAPMWNPNYRDPIVGSFDRHNDWKDYENLFVDIPNLRQRKCLDFGCGPGRNLIKYYSFFSSIDGVDMLPETLEAAKRWINHNNLPLQNFKLYLCSGYDLACIEDSSYDVVMSTICMQHICVYNIRLNYLKEFFRVLKPNGFVTIQMGYGANAPDAVDYYHDFWEAKTTNRGADTMITNPEQPQQDLEKIGFVDFKYHIGPTGPGDSHPNWIYFNARKP